MQDRFKVRVWNTLVKKFSYFDKPEMQIGTDGFDNGLIFPLSENSNLYMGKYSELQFCSGLKDKKGELIFEGDIVDLYVTSEKVYRYQVKNEIGSFMLVSQNEIFDFPNKWNDNVYPLSQLYFEYGNEENFITQCEVIGNIYENPELIGGAK
jgi:uncharacterized phage protein (TIGR01671 family)